MLLSAPSARRPACYGSAGDDVEAPYQQVQGGAVEGNAAAHGLQQAVRLLMDLLLHEMVEAAPPTKHITSSADSGFVRETNTHGKGGDRLGSNNQLCIC